MVLDMKITADENIPYVLDAFKSLGDVHICNGRNLSQHELKQTDILLVRSVTNVNEALLHDTSVQFVASATAGFNHIDLEYLKSQNIDFARAPGSNAISAAEYVFAGICLWSSQNKKSLSNLSIGIIGYGNVGSRVKLLCEAAGLKFVLNDPPLEQTQQINNNHIGFSTIDEALACDIVTLHTPLSHKGEYPTFQFFNKQKINQLKPDTLFINASRGEVVEELALLSRMNKQKDLTLILDVWENEPRINTDMLKHTLIGTPHIAGYSIDAKVRGTEMIYLATCKYLNTSPQWSAERIEFENIKPHIDISDIRSIQNPQKQILDAYDIRVDNTDLKKVLDDQSLTVGHYFDSLRKGYPARREYSSLK